MSDSYAAEWGGFSMFPNALFDKHGADLGVYGLAVFMALARFAGQDKACFPAIKTVAKSIGCSENKVRDSIKMLVDLGWLVVTERHNQKGQTSNLYTLRGSPGEPPPPSQGEVTPLQDVKPTKNQYTNNNKNNKKDTPPTNSSGEPDTTPKSKGDDQPPWMDEALPPFGKPSDFKDKRAAWIVFWEKNKFQPLMCPHIGGELRKLKDEYGEDKLLKTMQKAVERGAVNLAYVKAILANKVTQTSPPEAGSGLSGKYRDEVVR
jgi:hypothetical protein